MVSSTAASCEHRSTGQSETLSQLPSRMFAIGHEPEGIRVTSYHTSSAIREILAVLDPEEVQMLRDSTFGTLIRTAEKPTFSGRFARYLLSRQLKIRSKHEAWFLFASSPVRFSLREFGIVTGLPCGKFPKQSKKRSRKNITETPYWPSLFGKLDNVSVKNVLKMLKRRTVKERNIRIKYACLAILASVLFPTTHHPKISKEHAELIKDMDQFFKYPWGRLAFHFLMSNLKGKDELALSQRTVSLRGFVHSIQLVLVEAVPELASVVEDHCSSGSEIENDSDNGNDEEEVYEVEKPRVKLSPGHARTLNENGKCHVISIINEEETGLLDGMDMSWSDDDEDEAVTNMLKLIKGHHIFKQSMFKGGATRGDVERMRSLGKERVRKSKKGKSKGKESDDACLDEDRENIATLMLDDIKEDLVDVKGDVKKAVNELTGMKKEFKAFKLSVISELKQTARNLHADVILAIKKYGSLPNNVQSDGIVLAARQRSSVSVGGKEMRNDGCVGGGVQDPTLIDKEDNNLPTVSTTQEANRNETVRTIDPVGVKCEMSGDKEVVDRVVTEKEELLSPYQRTHAPSQVGMAVDDQNANRFNYGSTDAVPVPSFSLDCALEFGDHVAENTVLGDHDSDFGQEMCTKRQRIVQLCVGDISDSNQNGVHLKRSLQLMISPTDKVLNFETKFHKLTARANEHYKLRVAGVVLTSKEFAQIWTRTEHMTAKMVDVLLYHIEQQFICTSTPNRLKNTVFLNTTFVALIGKNVGRFYQAARKETFKFPTQLVDYFDCGDATPPFADRFYFLFSIAKKHWIGVCIDCSCRTLFVLDCNKSIRNDAQMFNTLKPLSEMFPFLLRQVGRYLTAKDLAPLHIERISGINQVKKTTDSAVMSILLVEAHARGGLDLSMSITEDVLNVESQKLAVMLYEENEELL